MTKHADLLTAIAKLARLRGLDLPPGWDAQGPALNLEGEEALSAFCEATGWAPPRAMEDHVRAHGFPLLAYSEEHGWAVARKFEPGGYVAVQQDNDNEVWQSDETRLYEVLIPTPPN
ncbi:MAG: hypothetical protein KGN98_08495, partial [Alphaproteobacteria bacterium]|nr:hypothetical protein [Alphaproteobacteria bacterium]